MGAGKPSEYWGMGTAIGLCAALGVILGALAGNVALWLVIGAALGVVVGAVSSVNRRKRTGSSR